MRVRVEQSYESGELEIVPLTMSWGSCKADDASTKLSMSFGTKYDIKAHLELRPIGSDQCRFVFFTFAKQQACHGATW